MYAVSLLPSEYKSLQNSRKRNDRLIFIGLIAGLASIVVLVTALAIASVYELQLVSAKEENAAVLKQIESLEHIEQLQAQVSEMFGQINQTAGSSPSWKELVTAIGNATPPTVELTNITAGYAENVGKLTISGIASSHEDVSVFVKNLNSLEMFGEIRFIQSVKSDASGSTGFEIDISSFPVMPYDLYLGGDEK